MQNMQNNMQNNSGMFIMMYGTFWRRNAPYHHCRPPRAAFSCVNSEWTGLKQKVKTKTVSWTWKHAIRSGPGHPKNWKWTFADNLNLKSWALRVSIRSTWPSVFLLSVQQLRVNVRKQFELEIMGASSQYPVDLAHMMTARQSQWPSERLGSGPGLGWPSRYRTWASAARVTIESAGPARAKSLQHRSGPWHRDGSMTGNNS
jgi:hypothetical protein